MGLRQDTPGRFAHQWIVVNDKHRRARAALRGACGPPTEWAHLGAPSWVAITGSPSGSSASCRGRCGTTDRVCRRRQRATTPRAGASPPTASANTNDDRCRRPGWELQLEGLRRQGAHRRAVGEDRHGCPHAVRTRPGSTPSTPQRVAPDRSARRTRCPASAGGSRQVAVTVIDVTEPHT